MNVLKSQSIGGGFTDSLPDSAAVHIDKDRQELVVRVPAEGIAKLVMENAAAMTSLQEAVPCTDFVNILIVEQHAHPTIPAPLVWCMSTKKLDAENNYHHQQLAEWALQCMVEPSRFIVSVAAGKLKQVGLMGAGKDLAIELPAVIHTVCTLVEVDEL